MKNSNYGDWERYKYYVVSDGNMPLQLFLNINDAMETEELYIDMFNENGEHIKAICRIDGKYTEDF